MDPPNVEVSRFGGFRPPNVEVPRFGPPKR